MDIDITLMTRIAIPDGSAVELSKLSGEAIGFRLPCGRIVRPWVSLEIEEDDPHDLAPAELDALGIGDPDEDLQRLISEI